MKRQSQACPVRTGYYLQKIIMKIATQVKKRWHVDGNIYKVHFVKEFP